MPKTIQTDIPDILLIESDIFTDQRGYFFESYQQENFDALVKRKITFLQDNHTTSAKNVLRGLHYQLHTPQAKLIRVVVGEIFDVAVDVRKSSPSFGQWTGHILSAKNKRQMWIPEGFAHGYLTLSETSEVLYKVNAPYLPHDEQSIVWNDPTLNISWPIDSVPLLSPKDAKAKNFIDADYFL